jgi:hypothetical protein
VIGLLLAREWPVAPKFGGCRPLLTERPFGLGFALESSEKFEEVVAGSIAAIRAEQCERLLKTSKGGA